MSTTTKNYGLIKPELSDAADITAYNENWDKIDEQLKESETEIIPVGRGGTGANRPEDARANLGAASTEDITVKKYTLIYSENNYGNLITSFKDGQTGLQLFQDLNNNKRVEITIRRGSSLENVDCLNVSHIENYTDAPGYPKQYVFRGWIREQLFEWYLSEDGNISEGVCKGELSLFGVDLPPLQADNWWFRTWREGVCELWGTVELNVTTKFDASKNYCGITIEDAIEFPPELFTSTPIINITPIGGGYPCAILGQPTVNGADIVLKTEWEVTNQPIWVNVHAIGRCRATVEYM